MMTRQEAMMFGINSAFSAIDMQGEYPTLNDAINAYHVNIIHTLEDENSSQFLVVASAAYYHRLQVLLNA